MIHQARRAFVPGVLTALVALLLFVLGIAYNLGLASARIGQLQAEQNTGAAQIAAMEQGWQSQQESLNVKLAQIQQTLADMKAKQEARP